MSEVGKITRVQVNSDTSTVLVDVSFSPGREDEDIPFRSPMAGMWLIPEVGDTVEVSRISKSQSIAHSPMQTPGFGLPDGAGEGDLVIKLNANSYLQFMKNGDGSYDLEIDADGDIFLGSDGERVATESHTHGYSWGDNGGSGTTDPPDSSDLTDTEIE